MNFEFNLDDAQLRLAVQKSPQTVKTILGQHLDRAAAAVAAAEKREAPKGASSQLVNSVHVAVTGPLERMVMPATDYAPYVHGGRKPGRYPNMNEGSPFYEWVKSIVIGRRAARRKGGKRAVEDAVFLIGRSIRNKGIDPDEFIPRSFDASRSRVEKLMRDGIEAGIKAVLA